MEKSFYYAVIDEETGLNLGCVKTQLNYDEVVTRLELYKDDFYENGFGDDFVDKLQEVDPTAIFLELEILSW
jgi:hypothetical protein